MGDSMSDSNDDSNDDSMNGSINGSIDDSMNSSTDESDGESIGESNGEEESMETSSDEEAYRANDDYNYLKLWPDVQEEFQRGSTMEVAFQNICQTRGKKKLPSYSVIHNFLKEVYEEGFDAQDRSGVFGEELRSAITGQYLKFTKAINFIKGLEFTQDEAMLHNRLMFVISKTHPKKFSIIDSFTGERRDFQGPSNQFKKLYPCWPVWIDETRVLVQFCDHSNLVCLRLLKLYWSELKWSILDTVPCSLEFSRTVLDSVDSSNFMITGFVEENTVIRKGQISKDRITMSKGQIDFQGPLYYPKLEGEKIHAFQQLGTEQRNRDKWRFCKYILDESSARLIKNVKSPFRFTNLNEDYVWSNNKLFVCEYDFEFTDWFTVIAFDSTTLSWAQTNVAGSALPTILGIDNDGVLTVNAVDGDQLSVGLPTYKSTYRLPMRKPDKLRYLAWSKIRRDSLFFKSDVYEKLVSFLPQDSEFRHFVKFG